METVEKKENETINNEARIKEAEVLAWALFWKDDFKTKRKVVVIWFNLVREIFWSENPVWKEIFMITPNNIYHGDCYELIKQIPDKSVDLIYTDIPYQYESGGKGSGFIMKSKVVKQFYSEQVDKLSYGINYSIN